MHFIIQTVSGKVVHDFSFTLLQSIEYLKWKNNNENFVSKSVSITN